MPSENIISRFWELASNDVTTRLKAASQLLDSLHEAQMHHEEKVEVKKLYVLTCEDTLSW